MRFKEMWRPLVEACLKDGTRPALVALAWWVTGGRHEDYMTFRRCPNSASRKRALYSRCRAVVVHDRALATACNAVKEGQ